MYTLGLVSISFRDRTPAEILAYMKRCGLTHIEWGSDVHAPPERVGEIAALQTQYGMACSSYGTYFRLGETPIDELPRYVAAAQVLGTDILRLWCGTKNSEDYTETEKAALFEACRAAADIAREHGVMLCMECHNNTYTNRKEAALELMQAMDSPHFRMYWQPNSFRSVEENLAYARLLAPYTRHLHVFNWEGAARYPLGEARQVWTQYLECFDGNRVLLLEFMPDGNLESLACEASALCEIVGGVR